MRNSSLVWGGILLLLGGLLLAQEAGLRLPGGASPMNFFWPLLLILLGGWLILGVMRRRGTVGSEQASVDLQGASEAALRISHGAGELLISGGAGPGILASGTFTGGLEQSSRREGNRLDVRMNPPGPTFGMPDWDRYDWDMRLNSAIPITLHLKMGANKANVDLSEVQVTSLRVETGASHAEFTLPARGRLRADFSLGAASLTVNVPPGMDARIRVSQGISAVKVDPARFPRVGEYYQSAGYESAENSADIKIDAGAADISIR